MVYHYDQVLRSIRTLINAIEDSAIPLSNFFFSFFAILVLRYFGEGFSESYYYLNVSSSLYIFGFIHTVLFYIALAIGLTCIFQFATGEALTKTIRFVLVGFTIILMTPILDLLTHPHAADNMYLHPGMDINLLFAYVTLFGGFSGITLGLRTEIFTIFLGFFLYLRVKEISWSKCLVYAWLCYSLIFLAATSPIILQLLFNWIGRIYLYNNTIMYAFFLSLSCLFAFIIYCRNFNTPPSSYLLRFVNQWLFVLIGGIIALCILPSHQTQLASTAKIIHISFACVSFLVLAFSKIGCTNWIPNEKDLFSLVAALALVMLMNINLLFFFIFHLLISCSYSYLSDRNDKRVPISQLFIVAKSVMLAMIGYTLIGSWS